MLTRVDVYDTDVTPPRWLGDVVVEHECLKRPWVDFVVVEPCDLRVAREWDKLEPTRFTRVTARVDMLAKGSHRWRVLFGLSLDEWLRVRSFRKAPSDMRMDVR